MSKLSALGIKKLKQTGKHADGLGLYLNVINSTTGGLKKSWTVRFRFAGKQREMGIGTYPEVSLADARNLTQDIRTKVRKNIDPIKERQIFKAKQQSEVSSGISFKKCAELYIQAHEPGWRNPKHRQQWRNTLSTYAYPVIGAKDVADVDLSDVMQIIEPIWYTKTETASRLRGRIESVLSWAIVRGHRDPPNPALWRGHLDHLLPKRSRIQSVKHHRALDWRDMPRFLSQLRERPGTSARALEFTILTAARSGEVRNAVWEEIDWANCVWTIPAERMKMSREHRVPLSQQSIRLLAKRKSEIDPKPFDLLFFKEQPDKPYSDAVYRALFKRMKCDGTTAHGFRSSFRDWAGEETDHARETAELALAHQIGNAAERSYRRGDALEKRRKLMQDWANYLERVVVGTPVTSIDGRSSVSHA